MKYVIESSGNNSHNRRVKRGNMRFAGEKACRRRLLGLGEVKTLEKRK